MYVGVYKSEKSVYTTSCLLLCNIIARHIISLLFSTMQPKETRPMKTNATEEAAAVPAAAKTRRTKTKTNETRNHVVAIIYFFS